MAPMIFKGCVRCGGDLTDQGEQDYGPQWVCVQCGYRPVDVPPQVRAEKPQGGKRMRYVKGGNNRPRRDRGKGRKQKAANS